MLPTHPYGIFLASSTWQQSKNPRSLDCLKETLTLPGVGLFEEAGQGLKTTNCMESLMALMRQKTRKVVCWRNTNQNHRKFTSALSGIRQQTVQTKGLHVSTQIEWLKIFILPYTSHVIRGLSKLEMLQKMKGAPPFCHRDMG